MTIERIFIGPAAGEPQVECESIVVVAGSGVEGDRYFGRHDEPGQNISLIEAEELDAFMREHGRSNDLSVSRRNLIRSTCGNAWLSAIGGCDPPLQLQGRGTTLAVARVIPLCTAQGDHHVSVEFTGC